MTSRRAFLGGGAAALLAGAAPRLAWGRTEAHVLVIGAGLAGLAAARMLEAGGLSVAVIEGEERVGGRLHTLDDLPGAPEAGGIQVGTGYTLLERIAGELGVGLLGGEGAGLGDRPGNAYRVNGVTTDGAGWPTSPANILPPSEHQTEPSALLGMYARNFPALGALDAWMDQPKALDISVENALRAAGASDEARRLIEANFNGNSLAGMSQLHLARTFAIYRAQPGPTRSIAGGSQRLPEAMAAALAAPPRLGVRVHGIREEADRVTVATDAGEISARYAICTIPFAALRHLPIEAPLPPALARMVAGLPYTRASFAYLRARSPFWREDGLPPTLWTDLPLLGRIFVLGDDPPMLKLWTNGAGADMLDRMAPADAASRIIAAIEEARPSAKGQLEVLRFFSWQRQPGARGIYHHIGTGMAHELAAAVRHEGHRLHFAGEHLARGSSGMEAALESGEQAARVVLERAA